MFISSANINTATDGTDLKIKNYHDFYIIHSVATAAKFYSGRSLE
jgi:hypothetical protein